jgi:rhodanese-related sulfurtransferase
MTHPEPNQNTRSKQKWTVSLVLLFSIAGAIGALAYQYRTEIRFFLLIEKYYREIGSVQIDLDDFKKWETDAVLIDAREPEEYRVSHIRGSRNVPFKWAKKHPEWIDQIPEGKPVILYCSVGYRSGVLAKQLMDSGRGEVFNLYGGIFHWFNQGNPVYQDGEEVNRIHPFNDEFSGYITRPMDENPKAQ